MFDTASAPLSLSPAAAAPAAQTLSPLDTVKGILRSTISETDFRSWINPLQLVSADKSALTLAAPTRFVRDWVRTHYADRLLKLWAQQNTPALRIEIIIARAPQDASVTPPASAAAPAAASTDTLVPHVPPANQNSDAAGVAETLSSPLDPRYTFETFVTGPSNALAHAAALRIAEGNTAGLNPLYLHAGVGLGKTHLMQAIGWHIRQTQPARRVIYMSAEKFMFQFVRALRARDTHAFKEQFQSIDVLMIDDIQFICNKESTQQEFFHTFNMLVDQGKQVILSSSTAPADLDGLDQRLKSRMGMGLVASIQPATADLRLAVLSAKCAFMKKAMPEDVLHFLSEKVASNIRELEGALNRLIAHAELMNRPVTIDAAEDILQDILRHVGKRITVEDIQRKVADFYNLRLTDLLSPRRARPVARPRQMAMYLSKILTTLSLPDIGRRFGGRDHTTIIHGIRTVETLMATDPALLHDIEKIKRELGAV